jgi:hypothetical protein
MYGDFITRFEVGYVLRAVSEQQQLLECTDSYNCAGTGTASFDRLYLPFSTLFLPVVCSPKPQYVIPLQK